MSNYTLYGITVFLLILSFIKDKNKTKKSLLKTWKAFENIYLSFSYHSASGSITCCFECRIISKIIGADSGGLE